MKPSKEDMVHREQTVKKVGARSGNSSGGGSSQVFIIILLLLTMVAGGSGGWYLWQQLQHVTQKLESSNNALTDSESALGSLKSELNDRTTSLTKQKGAVAKDIALLQSEVRKLWDVTNKRNKKGIKTNKNNIAALSSTSKKQKSVLASQQKSTSTLSLTVSQLQDELGQRDTFKNKLVADLGALKEEVAGLAVESDMLKTLAVEQEKLLQGFKNGQLQRQIIDIEQDIKAINASRRQVSGRLDQLDKELGALYPQK